MRKQLLSIFSRANETENMNKSLFLYTQILKNPNLNKYLSKREVGDVFYNRSIIHTKIASFYFDKNDYKQSHICMRKALSDIRDAQIRYNKPEHKALCAERILEYNKKRKILLAETGFFQKKNQPQMDKNLLKLFSLANETEDMDKSFSLYTQILETSNLDKCLSKQVVGDVFYNRSINCTEIADFYFHENEHKQARFYMRMALSDVRNAQIRYSEPAHKAICNDRIAEYNETRNKMMRVNHQTNTSSADIEEDAVISKHVTP